MNNVKEDLIKKIVECLSKENEDREYHSKNKLNIPFLIAPLSQSLEQFDLLIKDLEEHTYYGVTYIEPEQENYYSNGTIEIELEKNDNELNEEEKYIKENDEYSYFPTDYTYKINFGIDERYWGFCQCSESDEDYDERHSCCGHDCDWTAPAYSIEKVIDLGRKEWEGDEHDYWDFEDEFYMNDKELADKKDKEETERKIRELQERISADSKKLAELTSDFPMDIDEELDKYKKTIEFMKKIGI